MKSILSFVLMLLILSNHVFAAIEIYVDGKKYKSVQEYTIDKASLKKASEKVVLSKAEQEDVQKTGQDLGVEIDLKKMKTVDVVDETVRRKLYLVGVEHGVARAMDHFSGNWFHQNSEIISLPKGELEIALENAIGSNTAPKLLISENGKMRIMTLNVPETSQKK